MNRILFILILSAIFLSSCKNGHESEIILNEIMLTDHLGKPFKIYLPKGYKDNNNDESDIYCFWSYSYPNDCFLTILCGKNAELKNSEEFKYTRIEKVNDVSIMYHNVKAERKAEFDLAVDKIVAGLRN